MLRGMLNISLSGAEGNSIKVSVLRCRLVSQGADVAG